VFFFETESNSKKGKHIISFFPGFKFHNWTDQAQYLLCIMTHWNNVDV